MNNKEWKQRYIERLIRHGLTKRASVENYIAMGEIDCDINPESVADDEISYMKGDC